MDWYPERYLGVKSPRAWTNTGGVGKSTAEAMSNAVIPSADGAIGAQIAGDSLRSPSRTGKPEAVPKRSSHIAGRGGRGGTPKQHSGQPQAVNPVL